MTASGNQSSENRGINWRTVFRIVLVQVFVMLALSASIIFYLDWSSNVAAEEFAAANESAQVPEHPQRIQTLFWTVERQTPCLRAL
jgi:hypothetical protein